MSITAKIDVHDHDLVAAIKGFMGRILAMDAIDAVMAPLMLPMKHVVMPTLVTDPDKLDGVDPLAPSYPLNAAKVLSRLTRKPTGARIVALLRPCEIRAFTELVKLNQGHKEEVIIIGVDCLGAFKNSDYTRFISDQPTAGTRRFYQRVLAGEQDPGDGVSLTAACRSCEHPLPTGADIAIGLWGVDTAAEMLVEGRSTAGDELLAGLDLPPMNIPAGRQSAVKTLIDHRKSYRDQMIAQTASDTADLQRLTAYLAACVNCYNCRVACPVCYCRECVFVTDVFDHEPFQYLRWARRKGRIKMPTDTVFYHLTRLAHMSTSCVGCGQCSNACPNEIPLTELFRTIAHRTQRAFDYAAGRNPAEKPPLTVFREDEFQDVVGIQA